MRLCGEFLCQPKPNFQAILDWKKDDYWESHGYALQDYIRRKSEMAHAEIQEFMDRVAARNSGETEFLQAVEEVMMDIVPFAKNHPVYSKNSLLERIVEPDRVIMFRVCWEDDQGEVHVNRGYRVQFNNAIGPYKGGIRFHPSVNLSILKFLAFEQTFKNSLTTLSLGGGKGGSDFNPKGRSDREVMRFCQSFMLELSRHIGQFRDVPAGDIGVGAREVSYLFGQYKRVAAEFTGVLTGKGLSFGGSLIRTEATGYGCVYLVAEALAHKGESLEGKVCAISGSGNVAQYACEKAIALGGKVVTLSDSSGSIYFPEGLTQEHLDWVKELKEVRRGRIHEFVDKFGGTYLQGERPWKHVACDVALPCATQNELDEDDAKALVANGCKLVAEGANMPTTAAGTDVFLEHRVVFLPGKAANAGGVAVSGLEMMQNSMRLSWSWDELDKRLQTIMKDIHTTCVTYGSKDGDDYVDYRKGANIGGFIKVADAMNAYGVM